ncbi:MAG: YggS family pyridoxal phosphate-dependent enzyme [Bacteroidales bacterium]|nr:YggS family pyridoxal phosphate-dependent enzyme [Bacteroidales bacterium]MDZ4205587.1 YggS family pyridoxal phosphate-dependent enzyme [Bacteroidales bacterium]
MDIAANLATLKVDIPAHVGIIAVSKTHTLHEIMEAYKAGHLVFGENRVQELIEKQPMLPGDIEWHFVGHLQSNKVKFIAPFVAMIHSVDSLKLLREINREALNNDRMIKCLLQFHIATEETKYGLDLAEAAGLLGSPDLRQMKNIKICGVMGMATFTNDMNLVRKEFQLLKSIFNQLKASHFQYDETFSEISMGMTSDYDVGIEEGSTMVRIGTAIFGERFKL